MDIKKLNRFNFRSLVHTLSYPGEERFINPVFDSYILACASVLLFSEVRYCNRTTEDFCLLDSLTRTIPADIKEADYIFCNKLELDVLQMIKKGSFKEPEFSASVFYCHEGEQTFSYHIKGPGILGQKLATYPFSPEIAEHFVSLNKDFPKGFELYCLNTQNGALKALSRTTYVEAA